MVAEIELQTKSINQSMYIRRYIYIHTHVHHIYIQNMYIVHVIIFSIYTHAYIYICNEIAFRLPEAVLGTRFTWKATGQEAQWSYRVAPGVPGLRWKEGSSQLSTWPRLPTPRRQLRCKDLTPTSGRYRALPGSTTRASISHHNSTRRVSRVPTRDTPSYKNPFTQQCPRYGFLPDG